MSARDDDRLREQLAELESTLDELGRQLRAEQRTRGPPRPPSLGELLRFTDRYTIPTVIAMLEATIRSLELLQGILRLADPERSGIDPGGAGRETRDRLSGARTEASTQLSTALSGLRAALSEANENLPEEPEARSVIEDARELSREIERRLEAESDGRSRGEDDRKSDGPVRIEVTDEPPDGEHAGGGFPDREADVEGGEADVDDEPEVDSDDEPEVDVDAELESIKREFDDGRESDGSEGDEDRGDDESEDGNQNGGDNEDGVEDETTG